MSRQSHDPRLGRAALGLPPSAGAAPSQRAPRRGPARFLARTLGVLVAVAAVVGGIVALAAAVPTPGSDPAVPISQREWLMIAKDPAAHRGERIVVYGEVAQLDAVTGAGVMRAEVDGEPDAEGNGTNTYVVADDTLLAGVVEGDAFRAEATVVGAKSYDTQIGGNTTAPELEITSITRLPSS